MNEDYFGLSVYCSDSSCSSRVYSAAESLLWSLSPVDSYTKSNIARVSLRQHKAALIWSRICHQMFENRSSNPGTKLVLGKILLMTCQGSIQNNPSSFHMFQPKSFHVNTSNDSNPKFYLYPWLFCLDSFWVLHSLRGRKYALELNWESHIRQVI